ncbi:MAG: exodeoxyribonuclease VII large subunit [Defluviitaleaceae bacterium]|nr:exodeoxyribonuclease VII large subunit [Defluviitaleaceae bacterium]
MKVKAYKVSKIAEYIKDLLEDDMLLCSLWVEGEISGFVRHGSGHLFFTLKDEEAALRCVIFKNEADELPFAPKNGDLVRIYGRVSLYKKSGDMRLIGEFLHLSGEGNIYQSLEKLKEKLLAEGVFANQRPIPRFARKIAIVTSPTGAAVADMLKIIRTRNPMAGVLIIPALVQGDRAPQEIVEAIKLANAQSGADVLIVGRGGGSAEDLWAFNSEIVARAVYSSKIPTISAVGHETDFTLCDFAADLRCATPTQAAEVATPHLGTMAGLLQDGVDRLGSALVKKIDRLPMRLQMRTNALHGAFLRRLEGAKHNLTAKGDILEKVSPMAVLRRGFVLVESYDEAVIKNGAGLTPGQRITLQFQDIKREAEIL